MIIVISYWICR